MKMVTSYAQNREDLIIDALLGRPKSGFYVDVGAAHPDEDSVTKYFYEKGWKGINIDANKKMVNLLNSKRTRDKNICFGVSDKPGVLTQRQYLSSYGLSTFSDELMRENDKLSQNTKYIDVEVPVKKLTDILSAQKVQKIDFLKIDVEGLEGQVIKGNDWNKFRPHIVCIEANHKTSNWERLLVKADYSKVFFDGLNEYYVDNRYKKFNIGAFTKNYLDLAVGHTVVNQDLAKYIKVLQQKADMSAQQVRELQTKIIELESPYGIKKSLVTTYRALRLFFYKKAMIANKNKYEPNKTSYAISDYDDPLSMLVAIKQKDFLQPVKIKINPFWSFAETMMNFCYHLLGASKFIAKKLYSLLKSGE